MKNLLGRNKHEHKKEHKQQSHKLLKALLAMESSGGDPDFVSGDTKFGIVTFFDFSPESPAGRRSLCFDAEALAARKENKPKTSVIELALHMGIEILSEEEYRHLQTLGTFDAKSSSWIKFKLH